MYQFGKQPPICKDSFDLKGTFVHLKHTDWEFEKYLSI